MGSEPVMLRSELFDLIIRIYFGLELLGRTILSGRALLGRPNFSRSVNTRSFGNSVIHKPKPTQLELTQKHGYV